MANFIALALIFLSLEGWAQNTTEKVLAGFDPKTDLIADNYEAGAFLIYDCVEGHWTCVAESFYKDCEEKREQDKDAKEVHARCSPVGSFPTKKSCFQRSLFMTSQAHGTKFCVLPAWKEKEIIY